MSLSGTRKSSPRPKKLRPELKAGELTSLDREEREKRIRLPRLAFLERRLAWEAKKP